MEEISCRSGSVLERLGWLLVVVDDKARQFIFIQYTDDNLSFD